jgi:hypothetical protein
MTSRALASGLPAPATLVRLLVEVRRARPVRRAADLPSDALFNDTFLHEFDGYQREGLADAERQPSRTDYYP